MSFDLRIWSVSPVSLAEGLSESVGWHEQSGGWSYEGKRWNIVVGSSDRVEPEDVPEEVMTILPGIAFMTELNLSPIDAADAGRRFLTRTAKSLAKAAYGVIEDPQNDTIITPSGVKRFISLPANESASLLAMSWWMVQGDFARNAAISSLLDVLRSVLPDAMPRRYGLYEPPQHVYAETGRPHFEAFLSEHFESGVVWYPHKPVADVSVSIPREIGWYDMGFKCATFSIELDIDLLNQPGWNSALNFAWERISAVLQPFYGDVRTLNGYTRSRGLYWAGPEIQSHPVRSWFWRGIPDGPAQAVVIGEPYRSLWPSFASTSRNAGNLSFVSTGDWSRNEDIYAIMDPPPADLIQPRRRGYPPNWPFSLPPSNG